MLAHAQRYPSLNSYADGLRINNDGSIHVYIGPESPPDWPGE